MPLSSTAKNVLKKNATGFTFIEMLVAVVIMALIFGTGFANYRGFQQRQHLTAAVRSFRTDLEYAREQALSGTKPAGCVVLDWYRVTRVTAQSYDIVAWCDAGANQITVKTVDIPVYFDNGFNVDFKVLGRGTNLSLDLTINLKESSTSTVLVPVVVTPGGDIH